MVTIPDFHLVVQGSIPHGSKLVQLFIHFFPKNQALGAKICPFPWKKLGNILISHSHEPKHRFKAIKFMVGHFGWEHFAWPLGIRSVKGHKGQIRIAYSVLSDMKALTFNQLFWLKWVASQMINRSSFYQTGKMFPSKMAYHEFYCFKSIFKVMGVAD